MAKTPDGYIKNSYRMEVVEEPCSGGYVISFPELPGCVTYGDTIQKAIENAEDAKKAWLEEAVKNGIPVQEPASALPFDLYYKVDQKIKDRYEYLVSARLDWNSKLKAARDKDVAEGMGEEK